MYIFVLPGFCPEIGHILNGQVVHVTPKAGQAAVRFHCNKTHSLESLDWNASMADGMEHYPFAKVR